MSDPAAGELGAFRPGCALVTGAGARLGRAMAEALGARGMAVAVHYRSSRDGAEACADAIRAAGGQAEPVQADLSKEGDTATLITQASAALGQPVTVLVNSASTFADDSLSAHTRAEWDFHFEPNLRAPIKLSQDMAAALPANRRGGIVNLTDQRVLKPNPLFFTYALSKAALWQATRIMAQALGPRIRVNAIGPGPTLASVHQSKAEFDAEREATLTGRGSDPEEIVRALLYLLSAHSVTGQMIASDGGQHLLWQTPDIAP